MHAVGVETLADMDKGSNLVWRPGLSSFTFEEFPT
jgi:hypothetical protein